MPVPVKLAVCGPPAALSVTFSVPVRVPVFVGVNVTLILQFDLLASVVVHVVEETLKSPFAVIEILVSSALPLLDRVNVFAGLLFPTFSEGTSRWPG